MINRRNLLKILAAVAGLFAMTPRMDAAESAKGRPNFIFILTDDQGWAESSVPMHPDIKDSCCPYLSTPSLERLAKAGMRFSSGYSPGPL